MHEIGELGALLRREGLYSSHLSKWREQRSRGELQGLAPKKRGPKPAAKSESDNRVRELERENEKLRKRAERAEALVEVQKKLSELWEVTLPTPDDEKNS
jgi:transposase